jgi:hypothetical protein
MDALTLGLALGLGAGLSPGPLLVLVVGATLRSGFAAGARIATAPLLSDAPIVVLCVLVLRGLPEDALAALSAAGRSRSGTRHVPGRVTERVATPSVVRRFGATRLISAALLAAASVALLVDAVTRLA